MSLSPTRSPAPSTALATTAQWTAAARARERARPKRLLDDPLAAELAGPEGFAWLDIMKVAAWSNGPELYPVIRTRFFDDFLLDRCHRWSVRQVVLLAAGLDARAFRLDWPSRTTVYELDLPAVLRRKERTSTAPARSRGVGVTRSRSICATSDGPRRSLLGDTGRSSHPSGSPKDCCTTCRVPPFATCCTGLQS